MEDWNVVVTTREGGFRSAIRLLSKLGNVDRTGLFNVVVMKTADVGAFLEELRQRWTEDPNYAATISRVVPLSHTFAFTTQKEFEVGARDAALYFTPVLAGKTFHVRFHRRGHKGELSTPGEERFLDEALLEALGKPTTTGQIKFDDPDAVVAVESIGNRAGLSVWTREDLQHYPFLRPD